MNTDAPRSDRRAGHKCSSAFICVYLQFISEITKNIRTRFVLSQNRHNAIFFRQCSTFGVAHFNGVLKKTPILFGNQQFGRFDK
ncbi:MAG: hypothetical protein DRI57_12820 [Deltaproteobacteria bacterium]|nr:MAG: hypothetical protein DRI57_12820 [Deltaproteobacteria bacterium]